MPHMNLQGEYGYLHLLSDCIHDGKRQVARNGNKTRSLFGRQLEFNLLDGFPLLTTKKVHFKSILVELLWFLRGDTNVKFLHDHGVTIWDEWVDENGELGPVYGKQWRDWGGHYGPTGKKIPGLDQIAKVIHTLKTDPNGRRHIVTAWNPAEVESMALPPCHCLFQFYVGQYGLECQLYQRSADMFLGVPFNIASYALLTHIIGHLVGLPASKLIITFGDCHIYEDHMPQAHEQLLRQKYNPPRLSLNPNIDSIDNLSLTDFELLDYKHHDRIKAEVHK